MPKARRWIPALVVMAFVAGAIGLVRAPGAGAVSLPTSIPSDCSRSVEIEVNNFIASVPDGSTVVFARNGCYIQNGQFEVNDRNNLTIDGNGSRFHAITQRDDGSRRANWAVQGGRNIVLRNMTVYGVYPEGEFDRSVAGNHRPYERRMDTQQGFVFGGTQGGGLYDSAAYNTFSDPVLVSWDLRPRVGTACTTIPTDIEIRRVRGVNSGRTMAIVAGERITLADSYISEMRDNAIDLETDAHCSTLRDIHVVNNRIGRVWLSAIAHTGFESGPYSGPIEIRGNVQEADPTTCWPSMYISSQWANDRRGPYDIRGNHLRTLTNGIVIDKASGGFIQDNAIEKSRGSLCSATPNDPYYAVKVQNSQNLTVSGNVLLAKPPDPGFTAELGVDALSTGITHNAGRGSATPTTTLPPTTLPPPTTAPPTTTPPTTTTSPTTVATTTTVPPTGSATLGRTEAESLAASGGCWSLLAYGALSGGSGRNCYLAGIPLSWSVNVPSGGALLSLYGYRDTVARGFRVRVDGGPWVQGSHTGAFAPSALFYTSPWLSAGSHTVELEWVSSDGSLTLDYYELTA